jgi:hypothetical protein
MQKVKQKELIKTAKKLTKKLKSWSKEAKLALEKSRRFTKGLKRKNIK